MNDPAKPASVAERLTRDRVNQVADAMDRLSRELVVPADHVCTFNRSHETTWNLGGPGSFLIADIRPRPEASAGPAVDAEVRVFLDEPRALLYARRRSADDTHGENLLPGQDACLRAASYAALFDQIRDRLTPVLASALVSEDEPEGPRP